MGVKNIIATAHTAADIYKDLRLIYFLQRHCLRAFTCITERAERSFFGSSQLYSPDLVLGRRNHFTIYNALPFRSSERLKAAEQRLIATGSQVNVAEQRLKDTQSQGDDSPATLLRLTSSSAAINRSEAASLPVNLLFLSNLIPSKGVYVLLDACKMLKDRGVAFQCNFVGGESKEMDRRVFEEAVKERGLEGHVLYHGPKYGEEKEHYWSMADVFVQPTYEDCFPLTILEAMQHGLPVVSTDEGAVPDMVADGENGFVCRRKDAEGLAQALERLLQNEALRHRMGAEGYRRYKEKAVDPNKRYKYLILEKIIEEPAPSFYLDGETFRGIVYKTLRKRNREALLN
jgi:glycosyltransferase involved in cell wall biosynthesis